MFDLLLLVFRCLWRKGKTLWFDLQCVGYAQCVRGQIPRAQCRLDVEHSWLADMGREGWGWGAQHPFIPSHHFSRASTNNKCIYILVVGNFSRQGPKQELILLLQTDPPSPHSQSVEEMKGVEMKNISTSNRGISIWSAVSSQILPSSSTSFPLSSVCINFFWQQLHGSGINQPSSIGIIFYNYRQTMEIKILWPSHQRWGGGRQVRRALWKVSWTQTTLNPAFHPLLHQGEGRRRQRVTRAELRGHHHEGVIPVCCGGGFLSSGLTQGWGGLGTLQSLWHDINCLFPWQTWVAEEENHFWLIHKGFGLVLFSHWNQRPPLSVFFSKVRCFGLISRFLKSFRKWSETLPPCWQALLRCFLLKV